MNQLAGYMLAACVALPAAAGVVEADDHGFVSAHEVQIEAEPSRVLDALVDEVGQWWDSAHTFSGDAANLSFDCDLGPCGLCGLCGLCEEWGDNVVIHLRLSAFRPDQGRLVLSGGLGPLQPLGVAGSMTFDVVADDSGTATTLRYRYIVHGRGLSGWAEPVDRVQLGQLMRLKRYVETGSPAAEDD
jgi:hypothetical protein